MARMSPIRISGVPQILVRARGGMVPFADPCFGYATRRDRCLAFHLGPETSADRDVRRAAAAHRERWHCREVVGGRIDQPRADRYRPVAQQRREDHQEYEREGESEEGRRRVPPERLFTKRT